VYDFPPALQVESIDEVESIQEVKRMYALTPAQARELKNLLKREKGDHMYNPLD
jgi:hypothetical protein